jgi:ribosomal-protein-alanine N-acetyltransferase
MSNPKVMDPIPQKIFNKEESVLKLAELIVLEKTSGTKIWCLCKKGSKDLIGICGVLKNDEREDEIAYRIIETYWGNGYGTEITKGLIDYCFVTLKSDLVTADVCVDNIRSVKILNKYFSVEKEFYNAEDKCMDRRYVLRKENWQ